MKERKIFSISTNGDNYVNLSILHTHSPLTFLIDTGAEISLCKEDNMEYYEKNEDDYCNLTGISTDVIKSVGSTWVKMEFGNEVIEHKIQVVKNDFPIKTDGILGRDFLLRYRCSIDYDRLVVSFTLKGNEVVLPIYDKAYKINVISIQPRCEMIVPFNVELEEDSVVMNREILKGVYIANTIIPKNGCKHLKILNVTDKYTYICGISG